MLWQTCSEAWQRLRTGWLRLKCMRMGCPHKPAVALVLDRTWCTCFEMRLPMALQTQDVWFQLQAEAAARAAQDVAQSTSHSVFQAGVAAEPMALDYTEAIEQHHAQVHYHVCAVPGRWLTSLQAVVRAQGMQLLRVGVCDAQGGAWVSCINLLPHRQMRLQQRQRALAVRCLLALMCGAGSGLLAHAVWIDVQAPHLADVPAQEKAQSDLRQAQALHDVLRKRLQQHAQEIERMQAQQAMHQHSLQWQAVLQANTSALWYVQLAQSGNAWRLSGQALAQADVHDLQTQLAALPIWESPPVLQQWQALAPTTHVRWPVWQFELVAQLQTAAKLRDTP